MSILHNPYVVRFEGVLTLAQTEPSLLVSQGREELLSCQLPRSVQVLCCRLGGGMANAAGIYIYTCIRIYVYIYIYKYVYAPVYLHTNTQFLDL